MKSKIDLELSDNNKIILKYDTENPGMIEVSYKKGKKEIIFGIYNLAGKNPSAWIDYNEDYIVILKEKWGFKSNPEKYDDNFEYKPIEPEVRVMFSIKDEQFLIGNEEELFALYETTFKSEKLTLKKSLSK